MSDHHAKDPKELEKEKPDYVEDISGSGMVDHQPKIGTDPMSLPQEDKHKKVIAPDPEKVRKAERDGKGF